MECVASIFIYKLVPFKVCVAGFLETLITTYRLHSFTSQNTLLTTILLIFDILGASCMCNLLSVLNEPYMYYCVLEVSLLYMLILIFTFKLNK
jgi:hypothetical protein